MEIDKHLWLRGMKQADIAEHLGISVPYLSQIGNGQRDMPFELVLPFSELIGARVDNVVKAFAEVRRAHKQGVPGNE